MTLIIAYDIGTTGVKTCLFRVDKYIEMIGSAQEGYDLYVLENGGAEQDGEQWWNAMCNTTREVVKKTAVQTEDIKGISFCSQMQGLALVDKDGNLVRRPMSYMDQRAGEEMKEGIGYGIQISGANAVKLLRSLTINKGASISVKDPLWKYKWVEKEEPEAFSKIYKWLDVKEYLICRATGEFVMTEDSAYSTFLYDTRPGKEGWNVSLCKDYKVNMNHLPKIIKSTDKVGILTKAAAAQLGLSPDTPVFGGGGDATLIGVGAGSIDVGDTHIYCGTSGWVSTVTDKQVVDIVTMMASIVAAESGKFNYFAEMETAGKCLEWVKEHLALDEIGVYLSKVDVAESQESLYTNLYDYMTETVKNVEPGAGGVIFTPWLHGNRCPFEGPEAAGMFFNIKLETGKTEMIRAVLEGVCYHLRWMLECQEKKLKTSYKIRFVGGGALSSVTSQILADITGKIIETVPNGQNVGAVGAAATVCVGLGIMDDLSQIKEFIPVENVFYPDKTKKEKYDKVFQVFKRLYKSNKENFKLLNDVNGRS